jgi:phospholipid-binding lipoprotein MlaA
MKKYGLLVGVLLAFLPFAFSFGEDLKPSSKESWDARSSATPTEDDVYAEEELEKIADPLKRFNRVVYGFNDKIYFYVIRPLAIGYSKVVPGEGRKNIRRFFDNAEAPVKFVNALLQGKIAGAGIELTRFAVNTTLGIAGFFDPARSVLHLRGFDEDFDQTLGSYGLGTGPFIMLPLFGPSSVRGTLGLIGDLLLDPLFYIKIKDYERISIKLIKQVNTTSFFLETYERMREEAIDPYIAMRNAYFQNRQRKVRR